MADVNRKLLGSILGEEVEQNLDMMADFASNQKQKAKQLAQKFIRKPMVIPGEDRSFNYSRILGHPEMINSHHWIENSELNCKICDKKTLCFFVWNKRMSENFDLRFFKHSDLEPIQLNQSASYNHPLLVSSDGQIVRMIPILEFIERLKHGKKNCQERPCDNEKETKKHTRVKNQMLKDQKEKKQVSASYWKITSMENGHSHPIKNKTEWYKEAKKHFHKNTWCPFDLELFHNRIKGIYLKSDVDNMLDETYACSIYMNHSSGFSVSGIAIKHPWVPGVDYLSNCLIPRHKHMSINRL